MACTHYQNKPLLISVGYARSCVISFHKHSLMHHQNRSLRCCCACCVCLCVLNYTCASVFTCAEWNIPTFLAHWLQKKEKISTNSSHKSFGLRLIFLHQPREQHTAQQLPIHTAQSRYLVRIENMLAATRFSCNYIYPWLRVDARCKVDMKSTCKREKYFQKAGFVERGKEVFLVIINSNKWPCVVGLKMLWLVND